MEERRDTDIQSVIFDLDDTLLDTFNQVKEAYQAAYDYLTEEHSLPATELWDNGREFVHLARKMGSINPGETLSALLVQRGIELSVINGSIKNAEELFADVMHRIKPFDGVEVAVEKLAARGIRLGIISDGPSERQWRKIDNLPFRDRLGDNVLVSGDFPPYNEKPKQTMFRAALERLGTDAANTVYVGDRDKDQIGANLAGMLSVRVRQGYSNLEPYSPQFEVEMPDFVIEKTQQIVEVVEGDWPRYQRGD
ncbi:MAG: HAD-IA family hydrolase [bacterium]|nr:HAD-IA family hydrolase [bacterium]